MRLLPFSFILPLLFFASCNEPEPITRCVIDRVQVIEIDENYFDDTIDEGAPDIYAELRDAESQSILFMSGVAEEAQLPVDLDFVAVNIEAENFATAYEFTVFDDDVATTQDFIAVGLPFLVNDHVDAERAEVDITDGATTIRVYLIWY